MKKTNLMLKSLPKAKKVFACLVTLSMVLSLNSAFLINVARAQDDVPLAPMEGEYMPEGDMPMDAPPMDMPPGEEGDFVGETPPPTGDMPAGEEDMLPPEDMGPPPEVLEDMEVSMEDLGLTEPAIKRDSIFYGLKTGILWPVHEALVFDPVNDAELKAHHADQMLADIKDLVDDQGIENVDPDLLTDSVDWFEGKLEDIKDAAENIKDEKGSQPAEVDAFLDEFADNHFYEHKILEDFDEQITEHLEDIPEAEDVFAALKDKQDEMLEDFGSVLTTVDDPEKIPERLATIADAQEGSAFKLIKTAEILKKLEEQVPEQGKAAIENARERTMDLLEEDFKALPAIVRAEKFEEYTNAMPGDETVQLSIFEQLKQLPDIPQDMLEKIEEIKEFAVNRFENKIEKFEKTEVKDKFFEKLTGDDLSDIMVLEELKAKISAKQSELRARVEQEHMKGLGEFKSQFTDVQSQEQAARFEKLVKEMTTNPNPKVFRLLNELEMEVAQDSEKAAFIDGIKNKTKAEFENKFREEGDRFFDRMASFDPNDMMVFREFEQEQFFDPAMMGKFFERQTNNYKNHIQNIDNPEMFNRFQERFQYAPSEVINIVKQDNDFEEMMQFKMRQMMEQEIMLKEREMQMQMERDWRLNEDDFQLQMRQVRNDDEKAALFAQRRESDTALMEQEFEQRKMMMEARFVNDPFCDAMCQEFQKRHMELEFENTQWNLQEDARMREFEMDMHMMPDMGFDPFAGKCADPKSCMDFCYQNPDLPECQVHQITSMPMGPMGPGDPMMGPGYMGPMGPPPCPPGEINMPAGPGHWVCTTDPYYKPPEFFKQCPPGNVWNEAKGFCEFDKQTFQPAMDMYFGPGSMGPMPSGGCPAGEWWDPGRNSCIRDDGPMGPEGPYMPGEPGMMPYEPYMPPMNFCGPNEYWDDMRGCMREDFKQCGPDEYFDFYEQRCIRQMWTSCPPGEYWDPGRMSCMRDVMQGPVEQCEPGYFWDFYKGACIQDQWAPPPPPPMPCPPGQWWDEYMHMCTGGAGPDPMWPQECKPGMYWDSGAGQCMSGDMPGCMDNWDPVCGYDNITYSNECYANQAGVGWQYHGECSPTDTPIPPGTGWCGDGICDGNEYCPMDCETGGWCGNAMCEFNEDQWSCPSDCSGGGMTCTNYATMGQGCNPSTGTCCSDGMCSNMYGPGTCVSSGTTGWCGDGMCDYDETYSSCPEDCGDMGCDYDGICDSDESVNSCPDDCGAACFSCYCGNYVCDPGETMTSCPGDCSGTTPGGTCASMGGICCTACSSAGPYIPGTECNCCGSCEGDSCPDNAHTTNAGACDYSVCPNGCNFDYNGCPSGCMTTGGTCGDGACNVGETPAGCPSDCGGDAGCPDDIYTTNAGACDYSYCPDGCTFNYNGCPDGCVTTGGTACDYDGMCDWDETVSSCPDDCGGVPTGCGSYVTQPTCEGQSDCIWCEGESSPYSCFGSDHVCSGGGTACDYDGTCDWDETAESCSSDCGATGCGSYTDSSGCTNIGCTWCEGESSPYSCFSSGHVCGGGDMSCNTWVTTGQACNPSTGICCSDGTCSNTSGPGTCESSGGGMTCNSNGTCDYDETMESCPADCSGGGAAQTCYDFGGMCCGASDTCSGYFEYSATDCPDYCCIGSCQTASNYCSDLGGVCCMPGDTCSSGGWTYADDCAECCIGGYCETLSAGCQCDWGWSDMCDCGSNEPPPTNGGGGCQCDWGWSDMCDCGGDVMGVMSIREADKIDEQSNIFGKVWQTLKAILTKDEPVIKATVNAHIPHQVLAANPYLKSRILWTEGDNHYRLISQYQPRVLGAKTGPRIVFPLVTVWQILTAPFK